jgi:hypothetical protein
MSASGMPYYTTVTRVKDTIDLSLVTLPEGTILFRGIKVPTDNPLAFYADYLGTPSTVNGSPTMCLKPTHNVFFYAHPLVCFGAHNVGVTFDAVQVVVLVKDVNVICMIRPSSMVRGEGKRYSGSDPIQRCSNFKEACGEQSEADIQRLSYDNCLDPAYQRRSSTRGWMAIANLDSIEPDLTEEPELAPTMAKYLQGLEKRQPGVGSLLAASTYVDATRTEIGKLPRTGFPEIVLYPYATPPNDTSLHQSCSSDTMAMALLAKQAKRDNLLYLPLATITAKGVLDMIGGHFALDRVKTGGDQRQVEGNVTRYLNTAMRYGLRLPFYGAGAMSFDSRTGFYILPQVATPDYRLNILPMDTNQAKKRKDVIQAVRKYLIACRMYTSDTYKKDVILPTGTIPNSFIFSRPVLVVPVFKAIKIGLPRDMYEYIQEASEAYKAAKPLTIRKPREAPAAPLEVGGGAQPQTPEFGGRTPEFGGRTPEFGGRTPEFGGQTPEFGGQTPEFGGQTPEFGGRTPEFGGQTPEFGGRTPEFGGRTPEFAPSPVYRPATPAYAPESPVYRPATPTISNKAQKVVKNIQEGRVTIDSVIGGYGKPVNPYGLTEEELGTVRRTVGGGRGTRRKRGLRQTQKMSKNPLRRYAEQVSKLWKVFAKKKMTK